MGVAPTSTHTTTVGLDLYDSLPGDIVLNAPGDGETAVDLVPTFTWTAAAQAESYLFELAKDADFNTVVYTATIKGSEHTLPQQLSPLETYYWRVRASNACGLGSYSAPLSFTTTLVVCDSPAAAIPDNNTSGVSRIVTVPQLVKMTDLNVWVDVTHPWVGDVSLVLEHEETGSRVTLLDRPGYPDSFWGCSGNDIDATFDDEALAQAEVSCSLAGSALSGLVQPNESLATFDGELWLGTWRLTVADHAPYDSGTLNSWCLQPVYMPLDQTLFLPLVVN
jgi:subtilisin-like proprotein convertase family protein